MKGARWRALGTQAFFSSAKLPQNKKWQIHQAHVTGSSCDRRSAGLHSWPLGGQVCFATMEVTQCVRPGRDPALPQLPGLLLAQNSPVLLPGGLQQVQQSSDKWKRKLLLVRVGLDDLMDCCYLPPTLMILWVMSHPVFWNTPELLSPVSVNGKCFAD